jgi:copper chaperone CopZ
MRALRHGQSPDSVDDDRGPPERPHTWKASANEHDDPARRRHGCRRCVREVTARLRDVTGAQTVVADSATSTVRLSGSMAVEDVLDAFTETTYRPDVV